VWAFDDDVIMLSPFQVDATKEKGYFAENTLAGSRMRTNIADLGAAISVVTKQQMEDTASLDVNDIFRYELGTEGSSTYTPTRLTHRNDGVADAIAGATYGNDINNTSTNSSANRVRGLGSPSFALNYYSTIAQIPFDSYNAASFEINRGPNSLLFGMGSPAGIVNMSTAQAQINKNSAQAQIRIDDRGSRRASLSFNKTLLKDKLAIYGALLYNDQQFERKPSYDITRRQYGAITYKPFKRTKITASVEGYDNDNRRPNSLMPRDGVTEWRAAGMPYYDSTTQSIVYGSSGVQAGVYAPSLFSPNAQALWDFLASKGVTIGNLAPVNATDGTTTNYRYNGVDVFGSALWTTRYFSNGNENPFYIPGIGFQNGRAVQQIAGGSLQHWQQGSFRPTLGFAADGGRQYAFNAGYSVSAPTAATGPFLYDTPAWASVYDRAWSQSSLWQRPNEVTGILTAAYGAVTDPAIYNWKDINLLSMNYGNQRNTNYNIELEQEILPGLLHLSAGWFRQDFDSMQSYTVAQMNATTLWVDTNKYYPDGTPNPYFGKVYVNDQDPDRYEDSQTIDQYRAMLAFTPDFTKNKGWTKWLGRHQFLGLASYMDTERTTWRKRLSYAGGSQTAQRDYMPYQNLPTWQLQGGSASYRQFYLSDTGDTVTQAAGAGAYNNDLVTGAIRMYDYATGQWTDEELSMIWNDYNSGTTRFARKLTSYSAAWNGYLWQDRVIGTIGFRRDINRTRGVTQGALNGAPALTTDELFDDGVLQTGKFFNRWDNWSRIAGTTSTMGVVIKPFLHWDFITKRSPDSLLWEFVENLGFSYNKSDNFNAPDSTGVDFFGNVLPKPQGTGKDYGVQFTLFKNKLYARLNWFESNNENAYQKPAALERLHWHIDSTAYRSWLGFIYMLNNGLDPINDSTWQDTAKTYAENSNTANAANVAAMQSWVAEKWGLGDWDYYGNLGGTIGGTSKVAAKGVEVTVQYNPLPNWTLKLTATKNETKTSSVIPEYDAWKSLREAQWDAAAAADLLTGAAKTNYGNGPVQAQNGTMINMADFWSSYGYYDTTANTEAGGMTIRSDAPDPGYRSNRAFYEAVLIPMEYTAKATEGQLVAGQRKYNFSALTNYVFERGPLKGWSVGGAQRYASKAIIGYYGKATGLNKDNKGKPVLDVPDITQPIYDDPEWHTDLWIAYTRKIFNDKVRMKIQLNVADVFQSGELKPVAVDYKGEYTGYRIMDPRTFILTATFDF
jgi:hypothetical protein